MATAKPPQPFLSRTWDYITETQIWRSIFRHGMPANNRNRVLVVMSNVFLHLVLTLLLSFTGYLLPWDQLAIWAITVGSNMARATPVLGHEGPGSQLLALGDVKMVHAGSDARFALLGGRFVGEGALLRFYV